ncbi:MAG: peptidoglycan-binding protein [Cellvibrio sp.]
MLAAIQKKTAEAIVNIFETGSVLGDYGNVTLIPGDTGHLTFGRSQTTLGSGNLYKLLRSYCANPAARFGGDLQPFLQRFEDIDLSLDHETYLKNILRASADDSIMRNTQDVFFDQVYWQAAERAATQWGITSALGVAVVYDSTVHGSAELIRNKTTQKIGTPASVGERKWITTYVQTRRDWLANHARADLRPTVYRMDAIKRLIDLDEWDLELPLVVRGAEISGATLNATPSGCYNGPEPGSRLLSIQTPLARGLDVRLIQLGLSKKNIDVQADGIFGKGSLAAVKNYQAMHNLPVTGEVNLTLIDQLVG